MATVAELNAATAKMNAASERLEAAKKTAPNRAAETEIVEKALGLDGTPREMVAARAIDHKAEGMWGFDSWGSFAKEVATSTVNKSISPLIQKAFGSALVKKAALGMGELVGSDGGFLVPPTFSNNIFERLYKENDLLKRTDQYTVAGNSMVFPRNAETSRATGSRWGGVRAYWTQEGGTLTRSAPTFGRLTLMLNKLACLAAVTEELLQDSGPSIDQYLNRVFPAEISFLVGNSLIRGTGAGEPLGVLNAPCKVSVTRTTAGHITSQDIANMWARAFRGMGSGENTGLVWFVNQDTNPDLMLMTLGIGTAGVTTYMPPGGLSGRPYATILGAPVVEIEWASTLGTTGDIILADMSQYVTISKGGMQSMQSMHFYFDTDQQAFRVTFRIGGEPWWMTALTPFQGTNTQSPFIVLT